MQIVSTGDNLHEMSNPALGGNISKYFKMLPAENFTQSAKRLYIYDNTARGIDIIQNKC